MMQSSYANAGRDGSHPDDPADFSLVLGGPLYRLLVRARLVRAPLDLMFRRILVITALAWLPLLLLSLLEGNAFDGVTLPFLWDVEVYARFLIAMPILLACEAVVHRRMRQVVENFRDRDLLAPASSPGFEQSLASAMRLRNSVVAEVALLVLVLAVGPLLWNREIALHIDTWYARGQGGSTQLTWAGMWFVYASAPIFQFLLLRWFFRLAIWWRFLWQVSRLPLELKALHPDGAGGLGFLSISVSALAPFLIAQSVVVSGIVLNRVMTGTGTATDFGGEIALLLVFLCMQVLGPLLFFGRRLDEVRSGARRRFGLLATTYAYDFERKWMSGAPPAGELLLGNADIQSLADLAGSSEVLRGMRLVPFDWGLVFWLAVAVSAPFFPLVLTVIPFVDLLRNVLEMMM